MTARAAGRLVLVSNRVGPVTGTAGGLTVALMDALRERGGLWFGWSGQLDDQPQVKLRQHAGVTLATLDLPASEHAGYYNGFANRCLWPLFHFRIDLARYDPAEHAAYWRVNALFARSLLPLLQPGDRIWIHDYHLFPLAAELRALGVRLPIGFFLHIPFPPRDILNTLPVHESLVRALFDCDLVGFQTPQDLQRFCDYIEREAGGQARGAAVRAYARETGAGAFPIGIDVGAFRALATMAHTGRQQTRLHEALRGRHQVIGVDRLDYSKGLLRRQAAFELLLERHPEHHGQVEFLQVAPISRGELADYRDFRTELEQAAARVNGRYARLDWTPVRCLTRALPRATLAALYRTSRVALVTPVRDGMNLVAKEYVAAQDAADPGVLVLSCFAGAAQQMQAALLVNPYDAVATAEALDRALRMPLAERRERHAALLQGLEASTAAHWRAGFLQQLEDAACSRMATYESLARSAP